MRPAVSPAGLDSPRGWLVVGAAFVSMSTVFGVAYSFGAFFRPMADEFGADRDAVSAVFSITAFLYFGLGIVSGAWVDRVGPRRVLLTGAVVMGAGLLLTSQIERLWQGYLTYGVGVGIGVACGYVPMVAVVGGWFERRRGAALGVAVAGIGVGTLGVAPLAAGLIDRHGWRTTYVVFGLASAALLGGCALVAAPPPVTSGAVLPRLGPAVRTRAFALLYASSLLMSLALFVPFVYLPEFAEVHGAGEVAAATLVGVIGGASIAGRLGIGTLADRFGHVRSYQGCFLVMACSYAVWLVVTEYPLLVLFAAVMGVGYGGFIALSPAVIAGIFGARGLGGTVGAAYTSAAIGALAGPPLAGVVIDATGTYRWAIGGALVLAMASWVVLLPLGRHDVVASARRAVG